MTRDDFPCCSRREHAAGRRPWVWTARARMIGAAVPYVLLLIGLTWWLTVLWALPY